VAQRAPVRARACGRGAGLPVGDEAGRRGDAAASCRAGHRRIKRSGRGAELIHGEGRRRHTPGLGWGRGRLSGLLSCRVSRNHKNSENFSGSTLASFRMFFNVPSLSSSCIGTTVPTFPCAVNLESLTWLPDCPEMANPKRLHRILITTPPGTALSFGNFCYLKGSNKRPLHAL